MLFEFLQKYRVMKRREIFAIRDRSFLNHAFDEVLKFFVKVREMNPDLPKASCLSLEDYEARHIVHRLVNKLFTNVIKTYSESEEDKKVKEEEIAKKVKEEEIAKKARRLRSEKLELNEETKKLLEHWWLKSSRES